MIHALLLPFALAAAFLAGCASPRPVAPPVSAAAEPPPDYVNAGIYEAVDPSDASVRVVLFLSPNHGFILRRSRKKEGLTEYRGQWSSNPDSLRLAVYDVRHRSPGDSARGVQRMDTVISCPISLGAAQPLPLLRIASPKGGPRLVTLAKPADTVGAWDLDAKSKKAKRKKAAKGAAKSAKGKKGKEPVSPPAAAAPLGTLPES